MPLSSPKPKLELMRDLVLSTGGTVEDDLFVTKHGIMLLSDDEGVTPEAHNLFDTFNISGEQTDKLRLAEFTARLTYLAFPSTTNYDPYDYHRRLEKLGHTSPYNLKPISFLIAGLSIEMVLELVSGKDNNSGRVTSSDTIAMNETLYYIGADTQYTDLTKGLILSFLTLRDLSDPNMPLLQRNQFNLCSKSGAIVVSMTRSEWLHLITSRLAYVRGCELEYQLILKHINKILFETS